MVQSLKLYKLENNFFIETVRYSYNLKSKNEELIKDSLINKSVKAIIHISEKIIYGAKN